MEGKTAWHGVAPSKEDYEKALKPFQRLDSSRNQNIAGSGLGLSISQEIINSIDLLLRSHYITGRALPVDGGRHLK